MLTKTSNKNGQDVFLFDMSPPVILRSLVEQELPFNELEEILLAFRVCEELERDALSPLPGAVDGSEYEQLTAAITLRMYYRMRLVNLAGRILRGDEATWKHLTGARSVECDVISSQKHPGDVG